MQARLHAFGFRIGRVVEASYRPQVVKEPSSRKPVQLSAVPLIRPLAIRLLYSRSVLPWMRLEN